MLNFTEMQEEIIKKNKRDYQEATGSVDQAYEQKLDWLLKRWFKEDDGTAARLIKPILFLSSSPFYQSIIADNLDFFKKDYNEDSAHADQYVALACLCGSNKIAEFLLDKLNLTYLSPGCKDTILGYVSASNNVEWAKQIATIMSQNRESMPKTVYGLAYNDSIIREISAIFAGRQVESDIQDFSDPETYEEPSLSIPPSPSFTPYRETAQATPKVQQEPHVTIMISTSSHQVENSVYLQTATPEQLAALLHQIVTIQAEFQQLIDSRKPGPQIHTQPISFL